MSRCGKTVCLHPLSKLPLPVGSVTLDMLWQWTMILLDVPYTQDGLTGCNMTPTSGCTSTIHIFLACTERIASMLVPYWFSLYSPCSMNLRRNNKTLTLAVNNHMFTQKQHGMIRNLLVVQGICIKLLFGDKVVLYTLLLMRFLGPSGICGNRKETFKWMWLNGVQ